MSFGRFCFTFALTAALLACNSGCGKRGGGKRGGGKRGLIGKVFGGKSDKWDGRFFLVDQRLQFPVMCCTMPADWVSGGKTTWSNDMANPVSWYAWSLRPDQRAKIIVSSQTVLGSSGAIRQVRMLQDPRVIPQALLEALKRDHGFTELSLTDAKFITHPEVEPKLREKRLQQAAERGIRLTQLISAELVARYDGRCGDDKRVLFLSLPMLVAESQATAMSRTTVIEIMMPMSYSCPEGDSEKVKKTLTDVAVSVKLNPKYIEVVNYIVSRRVEERIKVQNQIRNEQFELARSTSETQDRVRNMWS